MSEGLTALARAKINLFLHVGARRTDGYHPLASWMVFTALGDQLRVAPGDGLALTLEGPFADGVPDGPDNLVMKAARLMKGGADELGQTPGGAAITLTKMLPQAAGLGGGSADAAATLHLLNEFWSLGVDGGDLIAVGADLGSDVPACVYNQSVLATGRGERLAPGPLLPALPVLLVNPGVAVATPDVFSRLVQRRGTAMPFLPDEIRDAAHLAAALAATGNDLEEPACTLAPVIREVLTVLRGQPGAVLARMSGSGATCFAIFDDDLAAQTAAIALKRARPNWWIAATRLDC